ncbi:splicing regulator RBM11 [Discoglossus pictus]
MIRRQEETDRTIFVGNLDPNVKEEILYELFLQAGPLTKVTIAKDKEGNFKSFGFVCFKHTESVPYAVALLNGIRLYGRPIKLRYRFGSCFSEDSPSHPQGSENGFIQNPFGYGTDVMADSSTFSPATSSNDNSYLSQAYLYFHGMMSQFFASQCHVNGWLPQGPPYYNPALQWNTDVPFPVSEQLDCTPGPSSVDWTQKNLNDSEVCKKTSRGSWKRRLKPDTSNTESDSSKTANDSKEQRPKPRKRRSKRRRV